VEDATAAVAADADATPDPPSDASPEILPIVSSALEGAKVGALLPMGIGETTTLGRGAMGPSRYTRE